MSGAEQNPAFERDIYTVSRLNSEVRAVLEGSFPLLWVEGEISNLARPASGHIYFSLKDPHAQVRCAMFRMKRQRLRFEPENGLQVLIRARVGLYEGRGEFQLVVEHMEPSGEGALRQAFEQLKQKLAAEGLFDTDQKREIPAFPRRIGIITSPSGAAVRDVLTVLKRRQPAIEPIIYPVPVQGDEAPARIAEMIHIADRRAECDTLILTRGGGSLEDLMAFNDEQVARAIHAAETPIISAVGHEIDFTIADFVADYRAPTPSAAAELASPDQLEMTNQLNLLSRRLLYRFQQRISQTGHQLKSVEKRLQLVHPGQRLIQRQQRMDELEQRMKRGLDNRIRRQQHRLEALNARLQGHTPAHRLGRTAQRMEQLSRRLQLAINARQQRNNQQFSTLVARLDTLSPLATLQRGYSITRTHPEHSVILDAGTLSGGDRIETLLAEGRVISVVEKVEASSN
ncbi:MAG: exodeoxyribonuclease VII large subunit [Sedimenticola sp.]